MGDRAERLLHLMDIQHSVAALGTDNAIIGRLGTAGTGYWD